MSSNFKIDRLLNLTDHLHAKIYIYFVSAVIVENNRITTNKDVFFGLPTELEFRTRRTKS